MTGEEFGARAIRGGAVVFAGSALALTVAGFVVGQWYGVYGGLLLLNALLIGGAVDGALGQLEGKDTPNQEAPVLYLELTPFSGREDRAA